MHVDRMFILVYMVVALYTPQIAGRVLFEKVAELVPRHPGRSKKAQVCVMSWLLCVLPSWLCFSIIGTSGCGQGCSRKGGSGGGEHEQGEWVKQEEGQKKVNKYMLQHNQGIEHTPLPS